MAHRGLAPRHPPSVRPQNSGPTAVGCRGAIRKMVRHPHRRARRAARECQFPPQFSPLWKPPFPDPPSKLESTKGGGNRRGHWHGGLHGAALIRWVPNPSGAARRRPSGSRIHSAACPLLRRDPRGVRRVGRAGEGSFLTPPQPFMEFASSPFEKIGSSLSPRCAFSPPVGAGAVVLRRRPASRGRAPAKQGRGDPLNPLGDARVVRRPEEIWPS